MWTIDGSHTLDDQSIVQVGAPPSSWQPLQLPLLLRRLVFARRALQRATGSGMGMSAGHQAPTHPPTTLLQLLLNKVDDEDDLAETIAELASALPLKTIKEEETIG